MVAAHSQALILARIGDVDESPPRSLINPDARRYALMVRRSGRHILLATLSVVTKEKAAVVCRSPKGCVVCEGEDQENGLHRNAHQAQPARSTCHSVRGFGERRRTQPTARRRREWPHRATAPRVTEAADLVPQRQPATSLAGSMRCAVLVAVQDASIQAVFLPYREKCCGG